MTKKEAKARKAAWQQALVDGRVVRVNDLSLTSYPTAEQANEAFEKLIAVGLNAEIVRV